MSLTASICIFRIYQTKMTTKERHRPQWHLVLSWQQQIKANVCESKTAAAYSTHMITWLERGIRSPWDAWRCRRPQRLQTSWRAGRRWWTREQRDPENLKDSLLPIGLFFTWRNISQRINNSSWWQFDFFLHHSIRITINRHISPPPFFH